MKVLVINGPNLNLLGSREPDVYGSTTLSDLAGLVRGWAKPLGIEAESTQTNSESGIVDLIQRFDGDGVVINAGALTHTSRAIADAIRSVGTPAVEVHISNVMTRESWRRVSHLEEVCIGTIYGRGVNGYRDALRLLANHAAMPFSTIRYGPHPDNVGDLRRGVGAGLVVLVHGGLWRQQYERDQMESVAVDLTRKGFHTWNLEYRRRYRGGGWPGSGHDVLTAFDYIPHLGLDPGRIVVVGHSAGSHLVMWAAARSTTPVDLHVALGPILDIGATVANRDVGADDAAMLLAEGCPPIMDPASIPTVLVHGENDEIVPIQRSIEFSTHFDLELHSSDTDHFSLIDPTGPDWPWVVDRIRETR